jgi:hypothetical protein
MMISLEDRIAMCGLDADEVQAIMEHEGVSEIEAAAIASDLLHKASSPSKAGAASPAWRAGAGQGRDPGPGSHSGAGMNNGASAPYQKMTPVELTRLKVREGRRLLDRPPTGASA